MLSESNLSLKNKSININLKTPQIMCKTTIHTLTVGATTAIPFPPTLANDQGFTSITEPADKNTTTLVKNGDIMIWKKSEDITDLNAITETGGDDVFSSNPKKQKDGTWKATVGNFPANNTQSYSITYTVKNALENPYTQDPKIKMNPK